MKKKIAVSLLIIILISFLYKSKTIYATDVFEFGKEESFSEIQQGSDPENFNKLQESGTVSTNGKTKQENVSTRASGNSINFLNRIVGRFFMVFPMIVNFLLSQITSDDGVVFTMERTVTNYYDLFNLNYLISPILGGERQGTSGILKPLSQNVSTWFIGVRNLALAGSVITLMYVGIRLAISSVAEQTAKLKKMLFSWFEGLAIMLLLQFFVVSIIMFSNWTVDVLKGAIKTDESVITVEEQIMKNVDTNLDSITELPAFIFYIALYCMFSFYEFRFFIIYMGRLVRVAFYIIISPLVCLTYPIDKIGDGSAQAFNKWILEFSTTVFLQPMHLLLYIIMINSMGEIIIRSPLLGVIMLAILSHVEGVFKSVLNIQPNFEPGLKDISLSGKR